jgi:hypothetical protein
MGQYTNLSPAAFQILMLTQVRHGTVDFNDFEAAQRRNFRICSGGF